LTISRKACRNHVACTNLAKLSSYSAGSQADGQTSQQADGLTDEEADRQANGLTGRQRDRQTALV